jgi:adenylosuccinate synthase
MTGRRAFVIVDLGFGDSGKGLLTDFLVRRTGAAVVVRYNGGAQAGHNVVTADGTHHTFAQLGAGTFAGARTFLSRHVVVHPTALLVEAAALARQGVADPLGLIRISERARVVTPLHQAMGRLRELARGDARHGSCGVGVGEAVQDSLGHPDDTVRAEDLGDGARLRRKLDRVRERKRHELRALGGALPGSDAVRRERYVCEVPAATERWIEQAVSLARRNVIAPDAALATWLGSCPAAVFEGAQGVLLDERHGFHPFTTWSSCTTSNADELLRESGGDLEPARIGILRSHALRHGPGPLPTETERVRPVLDHNRANEWQGSVRYGWFDPVLARYALDVVGGLDAIAVTHLDACRSLGRFRHVTGYRCPEPCTNLPVADGLQAQARLTQVLSRARPELAECPPDEAAVIERIQMLLGRRIALSANGPSAADVKLRVRVEGWAEPE